MPDQKLIYRTMTEADIPVTSYVRKAALEWMDRSQGREPVAWMPSLPPHFAHMVRTDPDGSWVAAIDGLIVGYAQAILRGDIWFLAQLFVQPEAHSHGLGSELLRRSYDYGKRSGARVFSVIASSSPVAQSLYMRHGMYATGIGYRLTGPIDSLLRLPEPDGGLKRIVNCSGWQDKMAPLDLLVFGAERRQDHALYLADPTSASFGLAKDGDLAGYGYTNESGSISPIAAYAPEDQLLLLRMAADWLASRDIGDGRMWVLSPNHTMLSALLGAGWRINSWSYFLSSSPFGQFDRYHPSGGILL